MSAGGVTAVGVGRPVLRAAGAVPPPTDEPETLVLRVDPQDGASGVFRDTPVIVSLSQPVDPSTVGPETFRVEAGGTTPLPGAIRLSPDLSVLIWTGARQLVPGVVHFVAIRGLQDRRGLPVKPHVSRFLPCDVALSDLMTPGA